MADNLRDRIAAVLDESLHRQKGIDRPDRFKDWIDNRELADAVMTALALTRESATDGIAPTDDPPPGFHRYVTEWVSEVKDDG